jgi:general L-amino acid transport system substrate-binding protein
MGWHGCPIHFVLSTAFPAAAIMSNASKLRGPRPSAPAVVVVLVLLLVGINLHADSRLERVRARGFLVCGVSTGIVGFAVVDAQGRYSGLDVDICRSVAAAIFGTGEKVHYVEASTVEQFLSSSDTDMVSRRLTWSLRREGLGLLFGPVMFYDGQGFMVPRQRQIQTVRQLSNRPVCVVPGAENEFNLNTYFRLHNLTLKKVLLRSVEQVETELSAGRCEAFTADVSELGSVRSKMRDGRRFELLSERISKEPLAQVVRQNDDQFFNVVRWTVFALIAAEELGVTSANIEDMTRSVDPDVNRLLGVIPGNGRALGLDEKWAYYAIKAVGNYGEAFERNVGLRSSLGLDRGLNRLWTNGGLMYAPSLRQ